MNLTPVNLRRLAGDKLQIHQPIHQFNGTMMSQLQALRQFPHRHRIAAGKSLDGQ